MATVSSLSAPGVEVREYDNSVRISSNTGTTIFVPGYAAQGPVEEVIPISSISDFETIYGIPTTAAERYFYYTCLGILNNSGQGTTLLTSRLPYGLDEGDTVANSYTLLAYPAIPVKNTKNYYSYKYQTTASTGSKKTRNTSATPTNPFSIKIGEDSIAPSIEKMQIIAPEDIKSEDNKSDITIGLAKTDETGTASSGYKLIVSGETNSELISYYSEKSENDDKWILHITSSLFINNVKGYLDAELHYSNTSLSNFDSPEFLCGTDTISLSAEGVISDVASTFAGDTEDDITYMIGAPATFNVSLSEYYQIISGELFKWQNNTFEFNETTEKKFGDDLADTLAKSAFIAINTSRAIINDSYEGYYFGITDNLFNENNSDYRLNAVTGIKFIAQSKEDDSNDKSGYVDEKGSNSKFIKIAQPRLDFALDSSNRGSISSVLQTGISSFDTSSSEYDDTINFGIFKLRKNAAGNEAMKLGYDIVEKYNASLGKTRVYSVSNAIAPQSYYVENIIKNSHNITILTNPHIATKLRIDANGVLRGKVRFLSSKLIENYQRYRNVYFNTEFSSNIDKETKCKAIRNNINNWIELCDRIGVPLSIVEKYGEIDKSNNFTYTSFNLNDNLYPFATYSVAKKKNKYIGYTPGKIRRALELVSNDEEYPDIDILVEGGLSTIYTYANNVKNLIAEGSSSLLYTEDLNNANGENGDDHENVFSEDAILQGIEDLRTSRSILTAEAEKVMQDYLDVQNAFQSLADSFQNGGRGDTFYIADILRGIVVRGNNKIERLYGNAITSNVYNVDDSVKHSWSSSVYYPIKHTISNFTSSYASVYAQWVKITDQFTSEKYWMPVSGYIAALMAASDQLQGPWYAAAGLNRGIIDDVLDCAINPNQKQRGDLYKICVNSVPKLSGIGITCWGIRTLSKKASAFDQNTCRRTFLFIEKAIKKLLRYYLFEPNTAFTRLAIYNEIEPYMESIRNQGGIYSYRVVCDSSNNTPEIVNAGNLAVDVSAAPTRTAEFIVLNMTANKYTQQIISAEFND